MKYFILLTISFLINSTAYCQIWDLFNKSPTIDNIADPKSILENAGKQELKLTGISDGDKRDKQNLTITTTYNNKELISDLSIEYERGKKTAKLSFTLKTNANGNAKITVVIDDGKKWNNITETSFKVKVIAVNGRPFFTVSTNFISIDEDAGRITKKKFITDINDGDPEIAQKINFRIKVKVVSGNIEFKTSPKIVVSNGNLVFEVKSKKYGEEKITLFLEDNGGTKNGGIKKGDEFVFTIKVKRKDKFPSLNGIPDPDAINEDGGEQIILLSGISSGTDNNSGLVVDAVSNNQELISNISIIYINGETTAKLKFSSKINKFGKANIKVSVDNGKKQNNKISKSFVVNILPIADTPSVTNAVLNGGNQTKSGLVIKKNAADGKEITHVKISGIQQGKLFLNDGVSIVKSNDFILFAEGNKGLKFSLIKGATGPGKFTIQASKGKGNSFLGGAKVTASIIINNDPPEIISIADSIEEITNFYSYDVVATDPNKLDNLSFTITIPQFIKPWLKVAIDSDRTATIFGTPPSGSNGTYDIKDQLGKFDEQTYKLKVNLLNKKPELALFSKSILEDDTIYFSKEDFIDRLFDEDGDTIHSIKVANLPQFGILKLNDVVLVLNDIIEMDKVNSFIYIPNKDYFGLDIFDWNASDGKDFAIVPQRVNVFISSVNDPPEILNFESSPITFEYGDQRITISDSSIIVDVDGDKIEKVRITISEGYLKGEDSLYYEKIENLEYVWQDTIGVLTIGGISSPLNYQRAILSMKYVNLNRLAPHGIKRDIEIVLYDSDTFSLSYIRQIEFENTFVDLDIPTGFTPNEDRVNDTWEIENLDRYENYQIAVFSRTGKMIFESASYLYEWDGKYNGEFVPAGNYYYLININKFEKVYKGTVFVMR